MSADLYADAEKAWRKVCQRTGEDPAREHRAFIDGYVDEITKDAREKLAAWMIENSFATGHGDTFNDLLKEITWQVQELRDKIWELEKS